MTDLALNAPVELPASELDLATQTVLDYVSMPVPEDPEPTVEELLAVAGGDLVGRAIQNASNNTARSAQQQNHMMGMSNLGHCRQYATLMMRQTPFSDVTDKTAAFIGTVLGRAVEDQLKIEHPDWIFQAKIFFNLRSGGGVPGHPDIIVPKDAACSVEEFLASLKDGLDFENLPQCVIDLKSKDQLQTIRKYGQTQQQKFQLTGYCRGAIDAGLLDPSKPIWLMDVYFDRSGRDHHPYAIGHWYDPNVEIEIDEWVNDVKYATIHGEDASRDMERDWCWSWCEYATACRGRDTDVQGLVTDPEFLAAVQMRREATELVKEAKTLKEAAEKVLENRSGSTGEFTVRWIDIGESTVNYTRKAYKKLDIRPVAKPKPAPKPRTRKKVIDAVAEETKAVAARVAAAAETAPKADA